MDDGKLWGMGRILQIKNVGGGRKEGKRDRERNILSRTCTPIKFNIDIVRLHYMRMTNWNIVSILNGGYKLHGSLIFNNDIIKRIIEIYPYDASLPIERNVVSLSNDFQNKFTDQIRRCPRFRNVIFERIFRSRAARRVQ